MPGSLFANDLFLYGKFEEDLMALVEYFVCRKGGLKVNIAKSKVMVENSKERFEVDVDKM